MLNFKIKKYLKFLLTGVINASVYALVIITFEILTGNRFISLIFGQIIISVFAFFTFSKYGFNVKGNFKMYIRFIISNVLLYMISSFIVFFTNLNAIVLDYYQFAFFNILLITPISYFLNNRFVFVGNNENV
jgi:hypothetical protein